MRWMVTLVLGYLLLALEPVAREALRLGSAGASPSLVLPLVVFVALFAPAVPAYWTALLLGLAADLATLRNSVGATGTLPPIVVIGPGALGFLATAFFVHTVRSIVMRNNPLTIGVLSIIGAAIAGLVATSVLTARGIFFFGSWDDAIEFSPWRDLVIRLTGALYTGGTGLVLGLVFLAMFNLFGFQDAAGRRTITRR